MSSLTPRVDTPSRKQGNVLHLNMVAGMAEPAAQPPLRRQLQTDARTGKILSGRKAIRPRQPKAYGRIVPMPDGRDLETNIGIRKTAIIHLQIQIKTGKRVTGLNPARCTPRGKLRVVAPSVSIDDLPPGQL